MYAALRSDSGKVRRVAVVGAGIAGLSTAVELAAAKVCVDLFSAAPARRAPSGSIQSGINRASAAGTADDHFELTLQVGEFLASQSPVRGMVDAAPGIIDRLDRMGVPFHRTPEGRLDTRRSGNGALRGVFAGATTGLHVLTALDEQARRWEGELAVDHRGAPIPGEPLLRRFEFWDLVGLVKDDAGACIGLTAQDLRTMVIRSLPFDAVVLATGGFGALFGAASGASVGADGFGIVAGYRAGAAIANAEFLQLGATAIHGRGGKAVIVGEAARAEGGRVWVPREVKDARVPRDIPERERDYFLERLYPDFGNLVAPDVAARAIHRLCVQEGAGVSGERSVYLDLTHLDAYGERLRGVTDVSRRFGGAELSERPMKVFPAVQSTLGGLWVDFDQGGDGRPVPMSARNHATTVAGLYAVGGAASLYHGAQCLPGNEILAAMYGGSLCAGATRTYRAALERSPFDLPKSLFEGAEKTANAQYAKALAGDKGESENVFALLEDVSAVLAGCVFERDDTELDDAAAQVKELRGRAERIKVTDAATTFNQSGAAVRHLDAALTMAQVFVASAKRRDESRGAHHKLNADRRDDAKWLASSLVVGGAEPRFVQEMQYACLGKPLRARAEVDTSLLDPKPREVPKPHAPGKITVGAAREKPARPVVEEPSAPVETEEPDEPKESVKSSKKESRKREKGAS